MAHTQQAQNHQKEIEELAERVRELTRYEQQRLDLEYPSPPALLDMTEEREKTARMQRRRLRAQIKIVKEIVGRGLSQLPEAEQQAGELGRARKALAAVRQRREQLENAIPPPGESTAPLVAPSKAHTFKGSHILDSNQNVLNRQRVIHQNPSLPHVEYCKRFDFEGIPMPDHWAEKYGVKDWRQAYDNKKSRPRVQKIISTHKSKVK